MPVFWSLSFSLVFVFIEESSMKKKKIFLASSAELKADREQFEIFINRKNKELVDKEQFLDLIIWENFLDTISQTRLQDEYNKAIKGCDIFVMLFSDKVGQYTAEEFETAFGQLKKINKPRIFTYFKNDSIKIGDISLDNLKSLKDFQKKLKSLGHFQTEYRNIEGLREHFANQLEKLAGEERSNNESENRNDRVIADERPIPHHLPPPTKDENYPQNFLNLVIQEKTMPIPFHTVLGNQNHRGFLPQVERLETIQPGENPYVTGQALPGNSPVFFGREQILHEIASSLRRSQPACISLVGERRIGKSSLLNQLRETLSREERIITIYSNAQAWGPVTTEQFFHDLHQVISAVLPKSTDDEIWDYPTFRHFIEATAAGNYRFVFMVDEFEEMADNPEFDHFFFSNLRELGYDPVFAFGFLLFSRIPLQVLCRQCHKIKSSSFWNIFGFPHVLGLLQINEAEALVQTPCRRSLPIHPPVDSVEVFRGAGLHPAFIQLVMSDFWYAKEGNYTPDKDRIMAGLTAYFRDLWIYRTREEWQVLIRIASGDSVMDAPALLDLRQRGLITSDGNLFSPLFGKVIKELLPGKDLKKALKKIANGVEKSTDFFDQVVTIAEKFGRVRSAFLGTDAANHSENEES